MPKYYEGEAVVKAFTETTNQSETWARGVLARMKEADVAPVVHGHWDCYKCSRFLGWKDGEARWADGKFYFCSLCRRRTVIREKYCPSCHAKMDEEETQ